MNLMERVSSGKKADSGCDLINILKLYKLACPFCSFSLLFLFTLCSSNLIQKKSPNSLLLHRHHRRCCCLLLALGKTRAKKIFVHASRTSQSVSKKGLEAKSSRSEREEKEIWDHVLIIAHSMSDKIKIFILRTLLCVELLLAFAFAPCIFACILSCHTPLSDMCA